MRVEDKQQICVVSNLEYLVPGNRGKDPLEKRQSKGLDPRNPVKKEVLEVEGYNPSGQSLCHWTALCNENHRLDFIALGCR